MQNEKSLQVNPSANNKPLSFFRYYFHELTHGHFMDKNDFRYNERRERVYIFLRQPFEIEKMMIYGWLLCLDVSLTSFTFLPLRIFYGLMRIIVSPFIWLTGGKCVDTALKCDLIKGLIFLICTYLMTFIDTSVIYHMVRAQTLIKLYIIYNMLEVADRLFSSFGQDILDALLFTVTEAKKRKREWFHIVLFFLLAVLYIFSHATLVLFQATTLNVAFNSHNKALLTIMLANNFVEIKGTVFKKYDKNNLFQISCADVRERFHYFSLMVVVLLRNMQQYEWNYNHFAELVPNMVYVALCEHFIDWFKHAFVVKFNHIPIESYSEFRATLAYDVANSRHSTSDHSDVVSRRLGFIPLPLAVLIFHVVRISVDFHGVNGVIVIVIGFILLHLLKVLNNVIIVGKAALYIKEDQESTTAEHQHSTNTQQQDNKNKTFILDPFEQRGNRTIIVPKSIRASTYPPSLNRIPMGTWSSGGDDVFHRRKASLTSSHHRQEASQGNFPSVEHPTPAQERSMRPPSVDHLVTAGKCGGGSNVDLTKHQITSNDQTSST